MPRPILVVFALVCALTAASVSAQNPATSVYAMELGKNGAMDLINWITAPEGQKAIAEFKVGGEQLFLPGAK